ncbi:hypothetical protein GCM10027271_02950 [Saccharopolyspora gloriosae]|uniref:Uncharacterized protein n=1 Tax=Saccharopolyspora gloriosae TaxID=455344 RepID=A0A840NPE5_9PSEU|nr:hypothetical protein [Saccharopolyspora gloriosae]MBB5071845.1 hypothetical protein [Saccharopolyspora gloriosae]
MTIETEKYRDELLIALRMHEISGARVGDVLAEVDTHLAESGEDPVEAFGTPREYAAHVAAQLDGDPAKLSRPAVLAGALGTAALTLFGLEFFIDGFRGPVPFVLADAVGAVWMLLLIVVAVGAAFRSATALRGRRWYLAGAVVAGLLAIAGTNVVDRLLGEAPVLFELPGWAAITLGAVLLAGAVLLLLAAIRRGRVVPPA